MVALPAYGYNLGFAEKYEEAPLARDDDVLDAVVVDVEDFEFSSTSRRLRRRRIGVDQVRFEVHRGGANQLENVELDRVHTPGVTGGIGVSQEGFAGHDVLEPITVHVLEPHGVKLGYGHV